MTKRDWTRRPTEEGGNGEPYTAALLRVAYDRDVAPAFSDESRVVNLFHADDVVRSSTAALRDENARLREALKFYADEDNYFAAVDEDDDPILQDEGKRARAALEGAQ